MRLRRRSTGLSKGRRRRQEASGTPKGASFAYRSSRSDQEVNTGRQVPREPADAAPKSLSRFLLQRFGLVVLLIALVFSVSNALSLSSSARVVMLKGDSSSPFLHDRNTYQQAASGLLASSVWNRNKLTVNTGAVSRGLLSRFPELSNVSVTLPLLNNRPTVYVETAQEALILSSGNGSFVIGTDGNALLNADNLSPASRRKLPKVTDKSGLKVKLNRQVLSSADVAFILTVRSQLLAGHVGVTAMDLPAAKSEMDVHISGKPYFVKFNLESGTARQQAGTFLATKAELEHRHAEPSQYIDVRVDGRAYYK